MRQLLTTPKSPFIKFICTVSLFLALFVSCNNPEPKEQDSTTTTQVPDSSGQRNQLQATPQGIKEFPYLKLTKEDLLNYFYEGRDPKRPKYKKLLLSYTIDDYTTVPTNSLTLLAHGATAPQDELLDGVAVKLTIDNTHSSPLNSEGLLFSTLELSEKKIKSLVEERPNIWKQFEYLVFIPDHHSKGGQTYLTYHVQLRPLPEAAAADQIDTNPCPPFKPND